MVFFVKNMYGWTGKILYVDLNTRKYSVENLSTAVYEKYIGGKGLAGYYLKDFITLSWDASDMPFLLFSGPLVNTPSPTSGRITIMSRSPLTGTICDSSVGGFFGVQMKRAGWDGIVIRGKSKHLCGIEIFDSSVNVVDAQSMRAMEVSQTMALLGREGSSAVIGPAAENGVLFSCVVVDSHHFAGRGGLGLVMAAKNLKYIKVKGSGKTAVYNIEAINKAREEIFRLSAASPALQGELGISNFGTGALYDLMHERRMMPTDNFRKTQFFEADQLNAYHYKQRYQFKKRGCWGCHILCKKAGKNNEMIPEFETMSHFTALLGNNDIEAVMEANRICKETGMDTISAAATIACYLEIADEKISSKSMVGLFKDIAYSHGIGEELKLGSYRYAVSKGKKDSAITVKKQELPAYDPRGAYGMALAYATSTRGGCHLRAYPISHEILRKPVATDRFTFSGKARIVKISEDLNAVIDSLTACKFLFFAATLEEYAQAFFGVTGVPTTAQDLLKAGERIYYNERIMNARNGFTSKDDDLPPRFFTCAGTSGDGITVKPINREDFLKAMDNYYKIRGLDENGMPTKAKCEELGIYSLGA